MLFRPTLLKLKLNPIKTLVTCMLLLNIIGLLTLYSSLQRNGELGDPTMFQRQIAWVVISWVVLLVLMLVNYRNYFDMAFIIFGVSVALLIAVDLMGRRAMGAQRWLSVVGFNFQPSEIAKIATILVLARLFSNQEKLNLRRMLLGFSLVIVSALLICKQPDLGTALILIFLFFMMGMSSGIKKRYFVVLIALAAIATPFGINHLKDYQKKRLVVFLNPNAEPLGAGYTVIQSKIAVGSGRILGKGFLAGTQNQFNFLPERHTDFIFTVIAEEWGFLGCVLMLIIYWLIVRSILDTANALKDPFARLLSVGISSLLFLHIFINIGMTLGILPVVGVPLLFVSYGGTHLLTTFILLGIFLNVCRND